MRYDDYGPEVNAILDVARAARKLGRVFNGNPPEGDIIQSLEGPAANWWWSLIEIILDHEDAAEGVSSEQHEQGQPDGVRTVRGSG